MKTALLVFVLAAAGAAAAYGLRSVPIGVYRRLLFLEQKS